MSVTFPNESSEYRAARSALLQMEIDLRRSMEAVAAARRAMPPGGLVSEDYEFDGLDSDGKPQKVRLFELFAKGKNSLIIYNFMFPRHPQDRRPGPTKGPSAQLPLEDGPCPSCVALLDQLEGAAMHTEPLVNLVVIAKAPIDQVAAFARDRGWRQLRLLSAAHNTFKRDYHGETADGHQMPLLSVFHRSDREIRHFWSSELLYAPTEPRQDPRHVGTIEPLWNLLDLTPEGRIPDWEERLQYDH
jgi:predicted dithiol-disulfide oxidoreductase (DUF899 family)